MYIFKNRVNYFTGELYPIVKVFIEILEWDA